MGSAGLTWSNVAPSEADLEHDELACITDACAMWHTIIAEAGAATGDHNGQLPEDELREVLPGVLAALSPQAFAMLIDWSDHVRELVAHVHRMRAAVYNDANRSSA